MYISGSFNTFENRLHTAQSAADLSGYLSEGVYNTGINTNLPYNMRRKWALEYVIRNLPYSGKIPNYSSWPFIN